MSQAKKNIKRFSPQFIETIYKKYDYHKSGSLQFDGFVHAIIVIQVNLKLINFEIIKMLKRLTGAFQQYDTGRNGNAHFTYEQYLASVIGNI